jgi:hypothetical protein
MVRGVGEKHRFTSKTRGKIRPRALEVSFKLCARAWRSRKLTSYTKSCLFLPRTGPLGLARPSVSTGTAPPFPSFLFHPFASTIRTSFLPSHLYFNIHVLHELLMAGSVSGARRPLALLTKEWRVSPLKGYLRATLYSV